MNRPSGTQSEEAVLAVWKERRRQAKRARTAFEPDWHLCLSYLANKQWVGWGQRSHRVLSMLSDPKEKDREHHTENVLVSRVWTAVGYLLDGPTRPDFTFREDDVQSRKFAAEANEAWKYAYEEELDGDDVLLDIALEIVVLGTAAGRCFFRRGAGQSYGSFPLDESGNMMTGPDRFSYVADAAEQGQTVPQEELQGELCWEPLSAFNMLPPPGVPRMRDFPYMIVERPVSVEQGQAMWPQRAKEIAEQDLEIVDAVGLRELMGGPDASTSGAGGGSSARLKDHFLLSTGYESPTKTFPDGCVVHWTKDALLEEVPRLPYKVANRRVAGIVPFHFRRVPRRFWGQGLVELGIGVQRQRNRARSQHIEHKDRNLGRVYAYKGTITNDNLPRGKIMELIEVQPGFEMPRETQPGPLQNVENEVRMLDEAMDMVTGFSRVSSLSQAPQGVSAYAALALFEEQDKRRNGPIFDAFRSGVCELAKITLVGIKNYWPPGKIIAMRNDISGELESFVFNAAQLPETFYTEIPGGPARPTSPAAMVQLVMDIFDRSVSSGQVLPLQWLVESLAAGKPMPLPHDYNNVQSDKAEYENLLMHHGELPEVAPYDNDQVHLEIHQADLTVRAMDPSPEAQQTAMLLQQHIQAHQMNAQSKLVQAATSPALQGPMGAMGGNPGAGAPQAAAPGLPAAAAR